MDAFFASVEQKDDPSLVGKPVAVGGRSPRSVVAAASYEARKYGVKSAMPMMEALRLCPHLVVVVPHRDRYVEESHKVFDVFRRYTPLVEGLSVDEAFLDVTASQSLFGDGETIARRIKKEVFEETRLTASAGVAPCKFVAKIASDLKKPDGLVVVREEDVRATLAALPIERMWGVGPKTAPHLRALGYRTLGDLADARASDLERVLGAWGTQVRALARGEDPREVDPSGVAKSVGAEETYEHDLTTREAIETTLLEHASRVAHRLVVEGFSARSVTVKLKYADFTLKTRQLALPEPAADTLTLHRAARTLLGRFDLAPGFRVRLTGLSVHDLSPGPPPKLLFDDQKRERGHKLEELAARIQDKLGEGSALTRATLLAPAAKGLGRDSTRRK